MIQIVIAAAVIALFGIIAFVVYDKRSQEAEQTKMLDLHAANFGMKRLPNETNDALRQRMTDSLKGKPHA